MPTALAPVAPRLCFTDWNVATAERLRAYFDAWRDLVPPEQIEGFLALLGDDAQMRKLAQDFSGRNRTLEETREKVGLLDMPCRRDQTGLPIVEDSNDDSEATSCR